MQSCFKVRVGIYRGAGRYPVRIRHLKVRTASALDACCEAESFYNNVLPGNEYAAVISLWPLTGKLPAAPAVSLRLAA